MAKQLKAKIAYLPEIESISRKFVPIKNTCSAAAKAGPVTVVSSGWMGGGVRTAYRAGLGVCKKNFFISRQNARMSAVSSNEIDSRNRFRQVSIAVQALLIDLNQMSNIQAMFNTAKEDPTKLINGVSAYGYTYNGWVFAVQYAGKKASASYDLTQFPTSFDA